MDEWNDIGTNYLNDLDELYFEKIDEQIFYNDAGEVVSSNITDTLVERNKRYGTFSKQAEISQELQRVVAHYGGYKKMAPYQREAINMILHKLARIINGDANYDDSWRDIAGYSQLVTDILNGKNP